MVRRYLRAVIACVLTTFIAFSSTVEASFAFGGATPMPRSILPYENTHTYNFYREAQKTTLLEKQILRDNDVLQRVEVPKSETEVFSHWATDNGDTFAFSGQPEQVTSTQVTDLHAVFVPGVTVRYFRQGEDGSLILQAVELIPSGDKATSVWTDALIGEKKVFDYWSTTPGGGNFDFNTPITTDTDLYAVYKDGVVLTPNSEGGTSTYPVKAEKTQTWAEIKQTIGTVSKKGYDLSHWALTPKGPEIDDNYTFQDHADLYAVWEPRNDTPYVVVNYLQNANDDNYRFASSQRYEGTTDSVADLHLKEQKAKIDAQLIRAANGYVRDDSVSEYNLVDRADLEPDEENTTKTIAGDGTTVYTLKWKRKTFTARIEHVTSDDNAFGSFPVRWIPITDPEDEDYDPTLDPNSDDFNAAEGLFVATETPERILEMASSGEYEDYRPEDVDRAAQWAKLIQPDGSLQMQFRWGQDMDPIFRPMLDKAETGVSYEGADYFLEDLVNYRDRFDPPLDDKAIKSLQIDDFRWT